MDVSEARKLRALENENAPLKRLAADLSVQNQILKELNSKKW
jgi:putative transposase